MIKQSRMRPPSFWRTIPVAVISLLGALSLLWTQPVCAVVSSADPAGNNSSHADTGTLAPDFNHLGVFNGGGGVYIGNTWVLSAWHLCNGCTSGTFTLPDTGVHNIIPSSITRLDNPTGLGLSAKTDLVMYRIDGTTTLPDLNIATSTPALGTDVTMIGRGLQRDPSTTVWDTNPSGWVEVPPGPDGPDPNVTGYKVGAVKPMRWGTNNIEDDAAFETDPGHDIIINRGSGDVISLLTDYDLSGSIHEAQAVPGDSGGGVFDVAADLLVGIHNVQLPLPDQVTNAAVDGNYTGLADLSRYESQITSLRAIPEPNTLILLVIGGLVAVFVRR